MIRITLSPLSWVGLAALFVACAPLSSPQTQNTPTAILRATRTLAPIETPGAVAHIVPSTQPIAEPTGTPLPAASAAKPTPLAVQPCRETQGGLSVADFDSATLGRRIAYSLYLPPCYDADPQRVYPVLYLLHGVNADHTQWPDLNVAPEADALIAQRAIALLVIVMPDGDYRASEDYAAFVLRDLMPHVEQTTRVSRERADRAIGGLSRGGYWALYLALLHPDLFSAVGGHSPVINPALTEALALPAGAAERSTLRIYLDVGRNDPLAPSVASFAAAAQAHHLNSVFHLYDGANNRDYWCAHTAEYLVRYAADWRR